MKRISVELVPRDEAELRASLAIAKERAGRADVINIPDLLRLPVRSWEGAAIAQEYFPAVMPHIRAMDIDLNAELPMKDYLRAHDIREVLVIQGDPPQDMRQRVYPTTTVDVLRKFHEEMPEVKTYAGIDQYRGSMSKECYRIERKLQAGAAGFFTQPFFDIRYVEIYADMMEKFGVQDVYWGVSPVLSDRSQGYWERKNKVVFPKAFKPTLDWSIAFTKEVMQFADENDASLYVMPIKTDLEKYLAGVFS
ncbi:methylenetetrahydrofolate reductase [uncultured Selenomonas sp.]|uniref:methylenetetrahydrofolate reductase n=1 Tax=uncultured Selenomonas sp. TaxID=159275 RepID=UPI0025E47F7F|nr:methylenetetrahydrofolate reductase [uncultured Selenomonas sp.]